MWLITSIPNSRVLKIEKMKNKSKRNKNEKENKKKQSLLSMILTILILETLPSSLMLTNTSVMSRLLTVDFIFIFYFFFFSYFLFLEQFRLGFISHTVTSVTSWWHSHKTDHGTWENRVEGSGIK